ncbi:hypothetical protein L218DRAFT_489082 [Marasmius fiardii PR-910]|nr:hypothetical protein L218DRAFT_489082 [Marasmius fiardii PR-910]
MMPLCKRSKRCHVSSLVFLSFLFLHISNPHILTHMYLVITPCIHTLFCSNNLILL